MSDQLDGISRDRTTLGDKGGPDLNKGVLWDNPPKAIRVNAAGTLSYIAYGDPDDESVVTGPINVTAGEVPPHRIKKILASSSASGFTPIHL